MKILPPSIHPWRAKIERRHTPPKASGDEGYRRYRQCLRWEFGFLCPFCLCHEADLALDGAEGTGITQTEHWIPISRGVAKINEYTNCLYICVYCNKARGAKPVRTDTGRSLLNPCDHIWDDWFVLIDDRIEPRQNEDSALYTMKSYDFNEPGKVKRRRRRRTAIQDRREFIEQATSMSRDLLERAMRTLDSELVECVRLLEGQLRSAWADLERYQAIPSDAKCPCACGDENSCRLPEVVEEQILEIKAPFTGGSDARRR